MLSLFKHWKNISIAKKLYGIIGIMAILIFAELITLWFAMNTLSAVRAFVGGEGLWSKAQKDAVQSLQRYTYNYNDANYEEFIGHLKVCDGDRIARVELEKAKPDLSIVRKGFVQGKINPDDIGAMVNLLRRFHKVSYIRDAIQAWTAADFLLERLNVAAADFKSSLIFRPQDVEKRKELIAHIKELNSKLTAQEDKFSDVLGEGSRKLEWIIITLLSCVVLMVESIGLTLAFLISKRITQDLNEISLVASALGQGKYKSKVTLESRDEIGLLGESINRMGDRLAESYQELEERVRERTKALEQAIKVRDDFLSIASHELKTPLTSISLQTQMRKMMLQKGNIQYFDLARIQQIVHDDEKQVRRLKTLVEEMLDVARISSNKIYLNKSKFDLTELTKEVLSHFALIMQAESCEVHSKLEGPLIGEWDRSRIEQVLENLITNAIKYAPRTPIFIRSWRENGRAHVSIQDRGMGIAPEDQSRIFMKFERAFDGNSVSGLGLGLYISSEIVKLHEGTLSVTSEVGQGSTFTLSLTL